MPVVSSIVGHGVAGQKSSHDSGNGNVTGSYEEMDVVLHKAPGIARGFGFDQNIAQAIQKMVPIEIVLEDSFSLNSSDDEVVDSTRIIDPCFPRHGNTLSNSDRYINL